MQPGVKAARLDKQEEILWRNIIVSYREKAVKIRKGAVKRVGLKKAALTVAGRRT